MNESKFRVSAYYLLAIIIVAAILRFNYIDQPYVDVFSWRQSSTAMMADNYYRTNWNIFFPEVNWGGAGPNYQGREFQTVSYLAALLYKIFGQHDWIGRSVAASFGVWGVFAFYQLVRLVWDESKALASAAVLAILPGNIFIDRSFLPDPAMVSLMLTSAWLAVSYFQTGKLFYLGIATFFFTWGALSKITGLLVGIPLLYAMFSILGQKGELNTRRLMPAFLASLIAVFSTGFYYLWAKHLATSYPPYHFAGSSNWIWVHGIQSWLSESYFLRKFLYHIRSWWLTSPIALLFFLGVIFTCFPYFQNTNKNRTPWIFHWWLLSVGIFYLIGAKELVDNPWNFHIFSPAIAAFSGQAILNISKLLSSIGAIMLPKDLFRNHSLRPVIFIISVAAMLSIVLNVGHVRLQKMYSTPWKEESYELGLMLRKVSQPGDLVVTMASHLGDPNVIYYSRRRGWTFPPAKNGTDWSRFPDDDNDSIQMFEDLRGKGADWLGVAEEIEKVFEIDHQKLANHIKSNCELYIHNNFGSIYRISSK